METAADGSIFSKALNLVFRVEEQHHTDVRLLRPYLPDGTSIATPMEEHHLRVAAQTSAKDEAFLREEEARRRQEAEARAAEETHRRQEAEKQAEEEAQLRKVAEAEIERLRAQLLNRQDSTN